MLSKNILLIFLLLGMAFVFAFPQVEFISPTLDNNSYTGNTSVEINVSIIEYNLDSLIYNWNGTNFTMYNDSLVLMMNFDNVSSLGENITHVVDVSNGGNNGTAFGGAAYSASGKYRGGGLNLMGLMIILKPLV